jgi:uncharacterized membrane protein required for colicin V production
MRLPFELEARMKINVIDLLVLFYLAYGANRGRRRGFARELPRAFGSTLAFVSGFGVYRWAGKLLSEASHLAGQTTSGLTFLGIVIGAIMLVRHFRTRIRTWAEAKYPDEGFQKRAGTVAGLIRTLMLSSTVILFISIAPLGFLRKPFTEGSLVGRTLNRWVRPVYETSHHH